MSLSVGCFRPISVVQHGVVRKVPCGKCLACLNSKSHRYVDLIDCETVCSDFCFFVTLTYKNKFLPLLSLERGFINPKLLHDDDPLSSVYRGNHVDRDLDCWYFSPVNDRLKEHYAPTLGYRCILPVSDCPSELRFDPDYFHDKFSLRGKLRGLFPYLEYRDITLFLKRVRKSLNKHKRKKGVRYEYKKIRFFVCGEYGPEHMRPHWHLLFFFDKNVDADKLRDSILSSWEFGSVICKLSDGKTSTYVSEYSVGTSSNSRLHQLKAFRPTVRHSTRFGEKVFEYKIKKIYEFIRAGKVREHISVGGLIKSVTLPRSCEARLYPRCFNFSNLSHTERLRLYTFGSIKDRFGVYGSRNVSQCILEEMPHEVEKLCSVIGYDFSDVNVDWLARILDVSNRFYKNCELYGISDEDMLRNIEIYYDCLSRDSLFMFYSSQREFMERYGVDKRHQLVHFYDNFSLPCLNLDDYHPDRSDLYRDLSFLFLDSLNIVPFFYSMKDFHFEESEMYKESVLYHEERKRKSLLGKTHRDKRKLCLYKDFV